jgi:hypothetical protein
LLIRWGRQAAPLVTSLVTPLVRLVRRQHPARIAAIVLVLIAAAAAAAALANVTLEPLRAHLWAAHGVSCGTIATGFGTTPLGADGTEMARCLQRAAQHCQAATLRYDQLGVDTDASVILVTEPAVPFVAPCGIAAMWADFGTGNLDGDYKVEHCASLALRADGLHADGCGVLGEIVVPTS